jgi:hypothetical protein
MVSAENTVSVIGVNILKRYGNSVAMLRGRRWCFKWRFDRDCEGKQTTSQDPEL